MTCWRSRRFSATRTARGATMARTGVEQEAKEAITMLAS
jgi:hypothetical protein